MKYRATLAGFINSRVKVGDLVDWDGEGNPPIAGLVPVDEPGDKPNQEDKPRRGRPSTKAKPE